MSRWSDDLLEFDALKAVVGRYVDSPPGRALLAALGPRTNAFALNQTHAECREAMTYLRDAAGPRQTGGDGAVRFHFAGLPEVTQPLAKLRIEGAVLDAAEILDLERWLDRAASIRQGLLAAAARYPAVCRYAHRIADLRPVIGAISGKILPDGTVADHASPALAKIRREMQRQRAAIEESLERFLRAHRDDGLLQEDFVTVRNERFVVPIVAGQRRKVNGVIHGASGTGQTLFVEPFETIELNNDLVRLAGEELAEVHRILRELTGRLREHAADIAAALDTVAVLDLLFGKARFGVDFDAVAPVMSEGPVRRLSIAGARHPLLEDVLRRQRKAVVPVTLELDEANRTLLISGPNTGGKTVAMKTAGLLVLMAQSGLPVPCDRAEIPVFEQVLADIGDNQSIEASLSSFSSHMTHVGDLLEAVTRDSLVLLDELGRATDPEEGGALAVALIDRFRGCGAFTIASTHLVAPKIYGATTAGVVNGSMGFDEATLLPTFVLRLGAPGKSAGLDIASRLGLPAAVLTHARSVLKDGERDLGQLLGELHQRLERLAARERELEEQKTAVARSAREQEQAASAREAAKLKELERRVDEAVRGFDSAARAAIGDIEQNATSRKAAENARVRASKTSREFQQAAARVLRPESAAAAVAVSEGVRVRLRDVREPARVRRVLSNGMIEVEAGFLKLQVAADDVLEVLPEAAPTAGSKLPRNVTFASGPAWAVTTREVNVIGKRAEEACDEVDKFLDNAVLASVERIRIVHGHGMGILKKAIGELLAASPHVTSYYPATAAEGGAGATIAELRAG
ncbi:MAG: endonuclease MutS2 [Acidobacteria bacterium]|nr:endonuclease MutS2 [Acidobacteriota bacterium]